MQLDPGLLAAIIERPDDDLLRLIAADWWQERGEEERAEFVRVQCKLAKLTCSPFCRDGCACEVGELRRRERELLPKQWRSFLGGPFADFTWAYDQQNNQYAFADMRLVVTFRRGFVESITCTWSDWTRHADAIRAATPLRRVNLTDFPPFTHTRDSRTRRIV